jgi:simple sugar transport system permease protein
MNSQSEQRGLSSPAMVLPSWMKVWLTRLAYSLVPLLIALAITGSLLLIMGVNPLEYYAYIVRKGLFTPSGLDATLTRMGPLLLIAASLIVAFRAGLWNLGGDGQFLLGAVTSSALAPALIGWGAPVWLTLLLAMMAAAFVGGIWALLPGLLKAWQNINEIITTMMMSFLGISLANVLVKLVFFDPNTTVPQTRTLPWDDRLPTLFGSNISSGLLIGLLAILAVHWMMTRTAFGLQRWRDWAARSRSWACKATCALTGIPLTVWWWFRWYFWRALTGLAPSPLCFCSQCSLSAVKAPPDAWIFPTISPW